MISAPGCEHSCLRVKGHPELYSEFWASLRYMKPCLKKGKKEEEKEEEEKGRRRKRKKKKGFVRQLMGTDAETHSQTCGEAWRTLKKSGRKDGRSQRDRGHHENIAHRITKQDS